MQTPMPPGWKNAEFGGAFATVVRKTGRGAKTKAGDAIVITCAGTCSRQHVRQFAELVLALHAASKLK